MTKAGGFGEPDLLVIGSADVMSEAAAIARVPLRIRAVKQVDDCRFAEGALEVLDLTNAAAGVPRSGHTEILASLSGRRDFAMLLTGKELRVIHVTTHVALRRVPDLVTRDRVLRTIRLARLAMDRLGRPGARIAVAGLSARGRGRPVRRRGADVDHPGHRSRPRRGRDRHRAASRRHAVLARAAASSTSW